MADMTQSIAHTRIYLTGFMGTGKSTLGPTVASLLGWTFIDLDDEIVRAAGRPIPDIFEAEGEQGFRRWERQALAETTAREHVVVALGGGAVLDPGNRRRLITTGVLVCLTARLATLSNRLVSEAARRPLLQTETGKALRGEALAGRIRMLLDERRAAYEAAHVTVDTDRDSIDETAVRIVQAVRAMTESPGERKG